MIFAPLIEEIGFRGVFYVTLRSRLRPAPSAILTAAVFAAIHPYSMVGFLMLCVSAAVLAWSYERTRSLLPAIIAHLANNLIVIGGIMLFYR